MRRGLLWSLVAVGAIAGVAAVGVALLANRSVSTRLARYALEKLDEQIPADVRFEHVSVQPLTGVIAVDGEGIVQLKITAGSESTDAARPEATRPLKIEARDCGMRFVIARHAPV